MPDGSLGTVQFDTSTGKQVSAPQGGAQVQQNDAYTSDLEELGLAPADTTVDTAPPKPTVAQEIKDKPKEIATGGDRAGEAGHGSPGQAGLANFDRSATNNYGYMNKPAGLGFAGALPGALGLAGKAVNAGIHANNTAATNTAREAMGLEKVSMGKALGNLVADQKGQVANVEIGKNQYSVGLEAVDRKGRTTMLPDEANKRAMSNATNIVESTPEQKATADAAFTKEHGGFFARAKQEVSDIFSSIFGREDDEVTTQTEAALNAGGLQAARDARPSGDTSKFPDKPSAPSGGDKGWGGMFSSERSNARGMSGQVSDSIERGGAGLY
jgi:hypothetical protein